MLAKHVLELVRDERLSGRCLACSWQHAKDPRGEKLLTKLRDNARAFIDALPAYRSHDLPTLTEKYNLASAAHAPMPEH